MQKPLGIQKCDGRTDGRFWLKLRGSRAVAAKGSMTYAFTRMGDFFILLLLLLLLLLHPASDSDPNLKAQILALNPNPSLNAQIPALRPKSQP